MALTFCTVVCGCDSQIIINFLQVTAIAVTINVDWTRSLAYAIGAAGEVKVH